MATPVIILPGDVFRCRLFCLADTQVSVTTHHVQVETVDGAGISLEDVADGIDNELSAAFIACLCEQAQYLGVAVERIFPLIDKTPPASYTASAAAGGFAGDLMPGQVTSLIKWQTWTPGRHGRGRTYFPFPSEDANTVDGALEPAYKTLLQGYANHLIASGPFVTHAAKPLFHGAFGLWDKANTTFRAIHSNTVRPYFATQMRRGFLRRGDQLPL